MTDSDERNTNYVSDANTAATLRPNPTCISSLLMNQRVEGKPFSPTHREQLSAHFEALRGGHDDVWWKQSLSLLSVLSDQLQGRGQVIRMWITAVQDEIRGALLEKMYLLSNLEAEASSFWSLILLNGRGCKIVSMFQASLNLIYVPKKKF